MRGVLSTLMKHVATSELDLMNTSKSIKIQSLTKTYERMTIAQKLLHLTVFSILGTAQIEY